MQFQIKYDPHGRFVLSGVATGRAHTEHGAREPWPQRGPVNSEVVLALVVAWSALRTRTAAVFGVCPARVLVCYLCARAPHFNPQHWLLCNMGLY